MNPIEILILFMSMAVLSIFLDELGFFKFLACKVVKHAGKSQLKLFTAFYIFVSIVTLFTSNDVVILTLTPFICYSCKSAKVNPFPYVLSLFVAANVASMCFIWGNPTNIYLATSQGINFVEYFRALWLPTLCAVITAYIVLLLLFLRSLRAPINCDGGEVTLGNRALVACAVVILLVCTVLLAVASYINVEMWIVSLVSACVLFTVALLFAAFGKRAPVELGRTVKRAPWILIPFLLSMFGLVWLLDKGGVTAWLGNLFAHGNAIVVFGTTSLIFANLINNIPMSVLFTAIINSAGVGKDAIYAAVIGSNLGAMLTPIGALAGLMWLMILKKNNIKLGFFKFIAYGVVITIPVAVVSYLALWLSLSIF